MQCNAPNVGTVGFTSVFVRFNGQDLTSSYAVVRILPSFRLEKVTPAAKPYHDEMEVLIESQGLQPFSQTQCLWDHSTSIQGLWLSSRLFSCYLPQIEPLSFNTRYQKVPFKAQTSPQVAHSLTDFTAHLTPNVQKVFPAFGSF